MTGPPPAPRARRERIEHLEHLRLHSALLRWRLLRESLQLAHSPSVQRGIALWHWFERVAPWGRAAWRWSRLPSVQALAAFALAWRSWRRRRGPPA